MAPRTNQKNRTRAAIMEAARALMSEGTEVTLAKVAERAQTSRATVYRYFSDPGVLALDATLDVEVTPTAELLAGIEDVRARVHAVAQYYLDFARDHEMYFRRFLAASLTAAMDAGTGNVRGARRVAAFEEALVPLQGAMTPDSLDQLAMRLSMTTGMEQFIILEDILRVDDDTADQLLAGLVDAVLDRYLPDGTTG